MDAAPQREMVPFPRVVFLFNLMIEGRSDTNVDLDGFLVNGQTADARLARREHELRVRQRVSILVPLLPLLLKELAHVAVVQIQET